MTIGRLLAYFVDRSRTASFGGSAAVVVNAFVMSSVVVEDGVVVITSHS